MGCQIREVAEVEETRAVLGNQSESRAPKPRLRATGFSSMVHHSLHPSKMCPLGLHHQQQQNLRRFAGTAAPATSFLWLSASLLRVYRLWSDFCFKGGKFVLSSAATPENVRYGPIFGVLLQGCGSRPPKPKVANSSKQSLGSGLCMVLVGSNIHTYMHTYIQYIHTQYIRNTHTHTCHLPYPTLPTLPYITLRYMT